MRRKCMQTGTESANALSLVVVKESSDGLLVAITTQSQLHISVYAIKTRNQHMAHIVYHLLIVLCADQ